jgi:hypothetical protein
VNESVIENELKRKTGQMEDWRILVVKHRRVHAFMGGLVK